MKQASLDILPIKRQSLSLPQGPGTASDEQTYPSEFRKGRVSIIIPTFNYSQFILACIKSVLNQCAGDIELIVVDDGSTDNTSEVLEPYKDRLTYIFQENAGLSSARNKGFSKSCGEYILFLDADDILGSDLLVSQKTFLDKNPGISISVCRNKLFKGTKHGGKIRPIGSWRLFHHDLDVHLCFVNIAPPHAFLYRREVLSRTGLFDTKLKASEDYDFLLRAAVKGFVPHFNHSGFVYYRRHAASMSANLRNQYHHDAILRHRLSEVLDKNPDFPHGRRLEGLMAFCAGTAIVACRIHQYQPRETDYLLELALSRIPEIRACAVRRENLWSIPMKLYFSLILSALASPCFRDSLTAKRLQSEMWKTVPIFEGPRSRYGFVLDIGTTVITGSPSRLRERLAMGKTIAGYLMKMIYPANG